jgi:hypothetical protein
MARSLGLALIAALSVMPLPAHDCFGHNDCCGHEGYHHGWQGDPQQGQRCWRQWTDAAPVETLQGTVAEINPLSVSPVVEIWLKTGKDTTLVRLAPEPFLKQNGFSLRPGDSLSVRGYRTSRGSELFVARELELAGKSLVLRGEHGRPAW